MARHFSILLLSVAMMLAASPAGAQFGNIFGNDEPPRPPGNVPGRRAAPPPVQTYPQDGYPEQDAYPPGRERYPQEGYPQEGYPQRGSPQGGASRGGYPQPTSPQGYPERLPPGPPPNARIQSQPLPPPPGAANAPLDSRPPAQSNPAAPPSADQPGQAATAPAQPLPGLPPGQRQPRGAPAASEPQPGDEVVTEPPAQKVVNPTAVFSGLDKITGRITTFEVAINETVRFGALEVTPRACYTRPPTENANTDGFIEVDEVTLQGELRRIFTGWMYAASPGLNAVEHPIYDVWLTDCKGAAPAAVTAEAPAAAPPPAPAPRRRAPPQRRAAPAQQLPPPLR